ncbi:MAG: chloride channel protein [Candidatus Melainabacteria bacterium]|nr:chloride channel protein [Candidatus Melainabacteria bacterium]
MPFQVAQSKAPVNIAVAEACVIGLAAAVGAVSLKWGVGFIGSWRIQIANEFAISLPLIGLIGGTLAGALVQFIVPTAAGSGIPQTKAALAGHPIRLDLTTAAVKLSSCVVALGSGLALGREGPTVQLAAALSSKFSGWLKTSPTHRIQLIAAGAGAGLAAAFNAPLAGVLFVLEELIKKMSGLAVGTTVVACFVAAVTSRLVGVRSLDINLSEVFSKATFSFIDIPFLIFLGMIAGVSASLFNKLILAAMTFNRDKLKLPTTVSCGLAGLLTGLVVMNLNEIYWNYAGLRALVLQSGTDISIIGTAFVMQLILTIIAYGLNAPGGLFAPSLMLGACLGHLVALLEIQLTGTGHVGTMAIVGMGAYFCAVARVPMTAVVIVFEMTQDFNVVLPLMVCCVVSYLVAERLDPGSLYDRLLLWSGISLDEESEESVLSRLRANRFMTRNVQSISFSASLASVKAIFEESTHRGFPVVDEQQKVIGIVAHKDVRLAVQRKMTPEDSVQKFMTRNPVTVSSDESLTGVLYLMEKYRVSRVPVVERDKLIGIITRKDVVSAESQALGMRTTGSSRSYPIFQTRSPESGAGRLLVAVGNPGTAEDLMRIAAQIAKQKNYELECLHVITVPLSQSPSTTKVSSVVGREIINQCETIGAEFGIPVHASIRVAHEVSAAIAETIFDRNASIFLMRYLGNKKSVRSDTLIQSILSSSTCEVILVGKLYRGSEHTRYQLPIADFLDDELPIELCLNLIDEHSRITLNRVRHPKQMIAEEEIDGRLKILMQRCHKKQGIQNVEMVETLANSPAALLAQLTDLDSKDVLIMGVPRTYLAKAINKGVFKKYLNKMANRCAIIITTRKHTATDEEQ